MKSWCCRTDLVPPEGRPNFFVSVMASKGRAPLYPDDILWNFEKFLIGRDGQVVQRFFPDMTPEDP
jgi:glutathione peroxidase